MNKSNSEVFLKKNIAMYAKKIRDVQSEQIKIRVIEKLQTTFPDSNITKFYKNCCHQYRITW